MMSLFNFKVLVRKYKTGRVLAQIREPDRYDEDNGLAIKGEHKVVQLSNFAIVPLSNNELANDEGGMYSRDDRKLYCYLSMEKGTDICNIQNNGHKKFYKIMEVRDYSDFDDGLFIYVLKRSDRNDNDN